MAHPMINVLEKHKSHRLKPQGLSGWSRKLLLMVKDGIIMAQYVKFYDVVDTGVNKPHMWLPFMSRHTSVRN